MTAVSSLIYITFVEKEGAFLKIWGQTDRNIPVAIEKSLAKQKVQFDQGHYIPSVDTLYVGQLVCAKYKDGMYYRARVTNTALLHQGLIEVIFIDYGNKDYLPYINTRTMANTLSTLLSIPPQAKEFILAHITHVGTSWDDNTLLMISNEIRYIEMQCTVLGILGPYTLIKLTHNGEDVALNLIARKLVNLIALQPQQMILQSYIRNNALVATPIHLPPPTTPMAFSQPPVMPMTPPAPSPAAVPATVAPPPALLTYKSATLEPDSEHAVYVSYVFDGPLQFSVQLKKLEDMLTKLMCELNNMALLPLDESPIPGTVCVAKCLEDSYICRAVVTSLVDSNVKVFYVDFGNSEVIPPDNIFQIPFKYVIPKVMAIRFALAGLENCNVTLEMKCAFKEFVSNRQLMMRVKPSTKRSALPTCDLWDEQGVNVLDVIKRAAMQSYPDPVVLNRGLSQEVRVSYVHSCNKFYVQLKSKENDLNNLMQELQTIYSREPTVTAIKEGSPCCAYYEADGQWYRAQIIGMENDMAKVRYIDYGNEELINEQGLKKIIADHITGLKPQAIECCLNGYQNMEIDRERDNLLEELILEKDFSMKVVDIQDNRVLVELFDADRYNVSSLLLEKIAIARSQVSPLLIQEGMKFDHRKRSTGSDDGQFRQKGFQSRPEKRDDWRQSKPFRSEDGSEKRFNRNTNTNTDTRPGFRDKRSDNRFGSGFGDKKDFNRSDSSQDSPKERKPYERKPGFKDRRENRQGFDKPGFGSRGKEKSFSRDNDNWNTKDSQIPKDSWKSTDTWNTNNGPVKGKKSDYRKDGSEKSWSDGSEKSWKKGPRTSSRNENKPKFEKKFDSRPSNFGKGHSSYNGMDKDNSWNVSSVDDLPDLAPADATYLVPEVLNTMAKVGISWFHNPGHFFCQLEENKDQINVMMEDIQSTYCKRKPARATVGSPVISIFKEDGVLYRAVVLEASFSNYLVSYVDFGNTSNVDEVYPIDRKFMKLPAQAILCGLKDVAPPGNEWAETDCYAEFFGKESFACSFVARENDRYLVELSFDNKSINEALISSGLATAAYGCASQIEMDILKGQQLRVTVTDVADLDNFNVFVAPDLSLPCAMHNLNSAQETFVDKLKEQVGNGVIIYIDDVINNRLEVTLYDTQGFKIEILTPDEGAYESVEPLCPLPVFYSSLSGYVSHVTEGSIFVQPAGYSDTISQLLDQLYQTYNDSILEAPIIPEVDYIYCVHSSDSNWYRARVTAVEGENCTVLFVDYGNTEDILITEVRELEPQFLELHMLALEVFMSQPTDTLLDQDISLHLSLEDATWVGTILQETAVPQVSADAALEQAPTDFDQQSAIQQPHAELDTVQPEAGCSGTVEQLVGVEVVLTHVDSPSEFYLQLLDSSDTINKLQDHLQEVADMLPVLESPGAGVLCAAQYSADQLWYRAQVLDADADITTVRFVDFGNTDVLSNESVTVKTLPPELLALEQYARKCSLKIASTGEEWTSEAIQRFEELTQDAALTAEIISQDEKTTYVELHANGQNVADTLTNEQLAVRIETPSECVATGYVSHLNSPSEFWIQLESYVADLEWIAEQLSSAADSFPELDDFTPGSLCAAVFPEDDNWYRARILSNTVAGIEVVFVDYGNSCTSNCLRALPEELVMVPPLAQKCSLRKPQGIEQWAPQAVEKFKEIAADGVTIFNVRTLSTGETVIVELLLEGEDVTLKLMPLTVDCYVTRFTGLDEFCIRKYDEEDPLEQVYKLEPLPGMQWNEESDSEFMKMNNDGQTLYQVEFVTSEIVRLYIDGRDIRTDLGGTKTTPSSSLTSTPKKYLDLQNARDEQSLVSDDISNIVVEVMEQAVSNSEQSGVGDSEVIPPSPKESATKDISNIIAEVMNEAVDSSERSGAGDSEIKDQTQKESFNVAGGVISDILEVINKAFNSSGAGDNDMKDKIHSQIAPILEEVFRDATSDGKLDDDKVHYVKEIIDAAFDKACKVQDEIKALEIAAILEVSIEDAVNHVNKADRESIMKLVEEAVENAVHVRNRSHDTSDELVVDSNKMVVIDNLEGAENLQSNVTTEKEESPAKTGSPEKAVTEKTLVKEELVVLSSIENKSALQGKESTSRPSSRSSGRFDVEERVVPAAISRPISPAPDDAAVD